MSTRDIHDQLQDLYGIWLSAEMVSKITDKKRDGEKYPYAISNWENNWEDLRFDGKKIIGSTAKNTYRTLSRET